jgi:excisionase family DNA binding protein
MSIPKPNTKTDLIRVEEAALILEVSWRTVQRMAARGELSRVKYGGQWRYKRSECQEYKANGMQLPGYGQKCDGRR